jgi:hypothetical protein
MACAPVLEDEVAAGREPTEELLSVGRDAAGDEWMQAARVEDEIERALRHVREEIAAYERDADALVGGALLCHRDRLGEQV